jgi:hypothetical protein
LDVRSVIAAEASKVTQRGELLGPRQIQVISSFTGISPTVEGKCEVRLQPVANVEEMGADATVTGRLSRESGRSRQRPD